MKESWPGMPQLAMGVIEHETISWGMQQTDQAPNPALYWGILSVE